MKSDVQKKKQSKKELPGPLTTRQILKTEPYLEETKHPRRFSSNIR